MPDLTPELRARIAAVLKRKVTTSETWTRTTTDLTTRAERLSAQVASLSQQLDAARVPAPDQGYHGGAALGISTHLNFRNSIYGADDDRTLEVTMALQPTYLRDYLTISFPGRDALWRRYVEAGVRGFHATVGKYGEPEANKPRIVNELLKSADLIYEVTGWNEPDSDGRTIDVWLPPYVEWQKWLWNTIKGDPRLSHIEVGLGAIRGENPNGRAEYQRMMGACKGYFEFGDVHVYPGARPDDAIRKDIDDHIAWAEGTRCVISETGGSMVNMSEEDHARVLTTSLVHLRNRGVDGFIYEVWDDDDPTGTDLQSHFGLYRKDGTPKPVVDVLAEHRRRVFGAPPGA